MSIGKKQIATFANRVKTLVPSYNQTHHPQKEEITITRTSVEEGVYAPFSQNSNQEGMYIKAHTINDGREDYALNQLVAIEDLEYRFLTPEGSSPFNNCVDNSNSAKTIEKGGRYEATLTPKAGFSKVPAGHLEMQIDANTWQTVQGQTWSRSNSIGITVDPVLGNLRFVLENGEDCVYNLTLNKRVDGVQQSSIVLEKICSDQINVDSLHTEAQFDEQGLTYKNVKESDGTTVIAGTTTFCENTTLYIDYDSEVTPTTHIIDTSGVNTECVNVSISPSNPYPIPNGQSRTLIFSPKPEKIIGAGSVKMGTHTLESWSENRTRPFSVDVNNITADVYVEAACGETPPIDKYTLTLQWLYNGTSIASKVIPDIDAHTLIDPDDYANEAHENVQDQGYVVERSNPSDEFELVENTIINYICSKPANPHTITYTNINVNGCISSSNTQISIEQGDTYSTTLTLDTQKYLNSTIVVREGESTQQTIILDSQNNQQELTISNVQNDITIEATCGEPRQYTVQFIAGDQYVDIGTQSVSVAYGESTTQSGVFTIDNPNYELNTIEKTSGSADVSYNSSNNEITVADVQSNVVVTIYSKAKGSHSITLTSDCVSSNDLPASVVDGGNYTARLTLNQNYDSATVHIGQSNITLDSTNSPYDLTISDIQDDIEITSECNAHIINVYYYHVAKVDDQSSVIMNDEHPDIETFAQAEVGLTESDLRSKYWSQEEMPQGYSTYVPEYTYRYSQGQRTAPFPSEGLNITQDTNIYLYYVNNQITLTLKYYELGDESKTIYGDETRRVSSGEYCITNADKVTINGYTYNSSSLSNSNDCGTFNENSIIKLYYTKDCQVTCNSVEKIQISVPPDFKIPTAVADDKSSLIEELAKTILVVYRYNGMTRDEEASIKTLGWEIILDDDIQPGNTQQTGTIIDCACNEHQFNFYWVNEDPYIKILKECYQYGADPVLNTDFEVWYHGSKVDNPTVTFDTHDDEGYTTIKAVVDGNEVQNNINICPHFNYTIASYMDGITITPAGATSAYPWYGKDSFFELSDDDGNLIKSVKLQVKDPNDGITILHEVEINLITDTGTVSGEAKDCGKCILNENNGYRYNDNWFEIIYQQSSRVVQIKFKDVEGNLYIRTTSAASNTQCIIRNATFEYYQRDPDQPDVSISNQYTYDVYPDVSASTVNRIIEDKYGSIVPEGYIVKEFEYGTTHGGLTKCEYTQYKIICVPICYVHVILQYDGKECTFDKEGVSSTSITSISLPVSQEVVQCSDYNYNQYNIDEVIASNHESSQLNIAETGKTVSVVGGGHFDCGETVTLKLVRSDRQYICSYYGTPYLKIELDENGKPKVIRGGNASYGRDYSVKAPYFKYYSDGTSSREPQDSDLGLTSAAIAGDAGFVIEGAHVTYNAFNETNDDCSLSKTVKFTNFGESNKFIIPYSDTTIEQGPNTWQEITYGTE